MTRIYIIRHAEAEGNVYRRAHGQYDSLLTAKAERQVEELRRRFKDVPLDAVYASDLYRPRMTVAPIAEEKGIPLLLDKAFREIQMGRWEDRPWGDVAHYLPESYATWEQTPWDLRIEGGETFQQVAARASAALTRIAEAHEGGWVAVGTHGGVIRSTLCLLMGLPFERISELGWCDNTGVSLLEYEDGRFRVVYFNDNSHLAGTLSTLSGQSWWKTTGHGRDFNMWFLCPEKEGELASADRWGALGEKSGSIPPLSHTWTAEAGRLWQQKKEYAAFSHLGEEAVGFVLLEENERDHAGTIRLMALADEDMWNEGFAEQLLGHAVSVFRKEGRASIRGAAVHGSVLAHFYKRMGFSEQRPGTWEKSILVPKP